MKTGTELNLTLSLKLARKNGTDALKTKGKEEGKEEGKEGKNNNKKRKNTPCGTTLCLNERLSCVDFMGVIMVYIYIYIYIPRKPLSEGKILPYPLTSLP